MDVLAAYADESDEDESPSRRRRSSESHSHFVERISAEKRETLVVTTTDSYYDEYAWPEELQSSQSLDDEQNAVHNVQNRDGAGIEAEDGQKDVIAKKLTRNRKERRDTEIPEEPGSGSDNNSPPVDGDSSGPDEVREGLNRQEQADDEQTDAKDVWKSPIGPRPSPRPEEESSVNVEPPPPRRDSNYSPSPSTSVAPSPAPASTLLLKMTASSTSSLVSYLPKTGKTMDNDDEKARRRHSMLERKTAADNDTVEAEDKSNSDDEETKSEDRQKKSSDQQSKEDVGDIVDAHELLENVLLDAEQNKETIDSPSVGDDKTPGSFDECDSPNTFGPVICPSMQQEVSLPPPPKQPCDPALADYFRMQFEMKSREGTDFNRKIQQMKAFKNPSIYEKLLSHFDIDEAGTNFPAQIFNPHSFPKDCYYDKIAEQQKIAMDRIEKEKKTKGTKEDAPAADRQSRFESQPAKKTKTS